ncbi:MAG: hypothetical protein R2751_07905 [Bacteroidales bacterium]
MVRTMLFGYYGVVEKISMVFMALFTFFTLLALFMVQGTPFAISWPDVAEGCCPASRECGGLCHRRLRSHRGGRG